MGSALIYETKFISFPMTPLKPESKPVPLKKNKMQIIYFYFLLCIFLFIYNSLVSVSCVLG